MATKVENVFSGASTSDVLVANAPITVMVAFAANGEVEVQSRRSGATVWFTVATITEASTDDEKTIVCGNDEGLSAVEWRLECISATGNIDYTMFI
jgi:hypothetical protein